MGRWDLELSKSSPIGPSHSVKRENAVPIGCIVPGGFGPGLGIAWVGKSRTGGAECSGHLCRGSCCQIRSRACLPVRPGGAGISRSMKGGLISKGDDGCLRASRAYLLVYVSACVYLAGLLLQRQCVK